MTVRVRSVPPCVSSQNGSRHLPLKQGIVSSSLTWRTKFNQPQKSHRGTETRRKTTQQTKSGVENKILVIAQAVPEGQHVYRTIWPGDAPCSRGAACSGRVVQIEPAHVAPDGAAEIPSVSGSINMPSLRDSLSGNRSLNWIGRNLLNSEIRNSQSEILLRASVANISFSIILRKE
jgi:hypothetical protein